MLETAIKAAKAAGRVLLEGSSKPLNVLAEKRHDVKLEMDRKAEESIISIIRETFPDHDILSEEAGSIGQGAEYQWVIDPLDGTYNYFRHIPFWSTSIGLCRNGEEVLGVVYDPIHDELFCAERGCGAMLNNRPIKVTECAHLSEATIAFAYGSRREFLDRMAFGVDVVSRKSNKVREMGSAALHLAYVACGRMDGYFEYGIYAWDVAAGLAILREAGGADATRRHDDGLIELVASNGAIHDELTRELRWNDAGQRESDNAG